MEFVAVPFASSWPEDGVVTAQPTMLVPKQRRSNAAVDRYSKAARVPNLICEVIPLEGFSHLVLWLLEQFRSQAACEIVQPTRSKLRGTPSRLRLSCRIR